MNRNAKNLTHPRNTRVNWLRLPRLGEFQLSIEHEALHLREELKIPESIPLDQAAALALIPNCSVIPFSQLPMAYEHAIHFRTDGIRCGALAVWDDEGNIGILFNDAHPPWSVRVYLMEEFFHIRLGHAPDTLRPYSEDGLRRTYSRTKEQEAYGCAVAALVPYGGLEALLAEGLRISRIAEHFLVPVSVVEYRIEATKLGDVANAAAGQLALLSR